MFVILGGRIMSTILKGKVSLDFYQPKYRPGLKDYFLSEEQSKFTGMPLEQIEICHNEEDRYPIIILFDDVPAGFFVLHGWEGVKAYSTNTNALLLRAYSINTSFQGKSIATQSLRLLPGFVKEHFPDKNEVILAVNKVNERAQYVYKQNGFVDKGIRAMGRIGEMHIYHMELE
jgi:RimJ/RimL family protein N-acetyltransferase